MTGLTRINVETVGVSMGITVAIMLIFAIIILVSDVKHKEVTMWHLLVFGGTGIIGVMVTKFIENLFSWELVLMPALYLVFITLNTVLNKNKHIGQADLDIASAVFAIAIPFMIYVSNHTCSTCNTNLAMMVNVSLVAELLFWLLLGCILDFAYIFISWVVEKIKKKRIIKFSKQKVPACLVFMPMLFAVVIEVALYLP